MGSKVKEPFIPPFCPKCLLGADTGIYGAKWYKFWGTYTTKLNPNKTITRFMCLRCLKSFSSQSFSLDFAVKKRVSYKLILAHGGPDISLQDWATKLACSPSTLLNRLSRLSSYLLRDLAVNEKANNIRMDRDSGASEFAFMQKLIFSLREYLEDRLDTYILWARPLETLLLNTVKNYLNRIYKIRYRLKSTIYYYPIFQNYLNTS